MAIHRFSCWAIVEPTEGMWTGHNLTFDSMGVADDPMTMVRLTMESALLLAFEDLTHGLDPRDRESGVETETWEQLQGILAKAMRIGTPLAEAADRVRSAAEPFAFNFFVEMEIADRRPVNPNAWAATIPNFPRVQLDQLAFVAA